MDNYGNALDVATTSKYGLEKLDETESEMRYNRDETETKHDSKVEDEILRLEARESLKRASIAFQAYKEIPETSARGRFSDYDTYLQRKTAYSTREEAPISYLFNGNYRRPNPSASKLDFDVATILKNPPCRNESKTFDINDYYYDTLRNKLPSAEPSGLVETNKWKAIVQRIESYRGSPGLSIAASTRDPQAHISRIVARRTSCPGQVTRTVEMQDLQGSDASIRTFCAVCDRYVQTLITYDYGVFTFLTFFVCCFIIPIFVVCAWIPFMFTGFMDVKHACPKCGTTLGIYRRV